MLSEPPPGLKRSQRWALHDGLEHGQLFSLIPSDKRYSRYSVTVTRGTSEPEDSLMASMYLDGTLHHHTAVFAVGDLSEPRRNLFSLPNPTEKSARFIVKADLTNELVSLPCV